MQCSIEGELVKDMAYEIARALLTASRGVACKKASKDWLVKSTFFSTKIITQSAKGMLACWGNVAVSMERMV